MARKEYDFIIVGFGLAGATLSHHLIDSGKSVYAFDLTEKNSSSRIAAGLYNPITGRKMVKTWKCDQLFPYLIKYYQSLQEATEGKFLNKIEIYRPFVSTEEQNEWSARSADESYIPYVKQVHYKSREIGAKDKFGGISLLQTGYLDVKNYLDCVRNFLKDSGNFDVTFENFDVNKIELGTEKIIYDDMKASKVIFCGGVKDQDNPFFDWLPFATVKGEILELECKLSSEHIINRGVFVLPAENDRFKAGSTYDNFDKSLKPTEKGKEVIKEKLNDLLDVEYKVVNQYAGIRPATKDRKPFVGLHPKYKNVGIFNGLGTKGVSLAPFFANQFTQYLVNQSALDKEVNIERFYSNFAE